VLEVAVPDDLLEIGIALCYANLDLVAELAALALDRVTDSRRELAARHLAGYAAAYRHDPDTALAHLDAAERLADDLLDMWQLASVRQARGIALRELGDLDAAMAAFESAMRTFALAGDAMHVNNSRYMMAATAADAGRRTGEALVWVEQCVAYARGTGNRHELAHAELTRARLSGAPSADGDLAGAVETFRAIGDLRCLARGHLLLAGGRPPEEQVALFEQALEVATAAADRLHQEQALEGLVRSHWQSGAHQQAATALGRLVGLVGYERATARCPEELVAQLDRWQSAVAEGRARAEARS
jgi:tetratricopeptide (TPR) repeat protein